MPRPPHLCQSDYGDEDVQKLKPKVVGGHSTDLTANYELTEMDVR